MDKATGYIIILHMCTKSYDRMMYNSSSDVENDRLLFWTIFPPFTSLTIQIIKILKKIKNTSGDIIILHLGTKNHDYMLYCSRDMSHV